ncbi:MAG: hypothetical protein KDC05_01230 [Bacteroidales bacterium]|nr:hypothetical protein [Bacteroidales bacterium]
MNPRIGQRSRYNRQEEEKPRSKAVLFIELNTKKNITIKQDYLYLEDVKSAMNIHHLEIRHGIYKWLASQLKKNPDTGKLIERLEQLADDDRHLLQKRFRISL